MNKQGYTLMEVSLFLAISGLLTLVAIVGIGPRLTNVRFSTGMRDIQGNLTKTLNGAAVGTNSNIKKLLCNNGTVTVPVGGTNNGGANEGCVRSGKIAIFETDRVVYRDIVSTANPVSSGCGSASAAGTFDYIKSCYRPRILDDSVQAPTSYTLPNGISRVYPSAAQPQAYGFVRSPADNSTFYFYIKSGANTSSSMENGSITYETTTDKFPLCYKLANRSAKLTLFKNSPDNKLDINGTCP